MRDNQRRAKLTRYTALKTAAGGSGSSGGNGPLGDDIRIGDYVFCEVMVRQPGGYSVSIKRDGERVPAYLAFGDDRLKIGEEIRARFAGTHDGIAFVISVANLE